MILRRTQAGAVGVMLVALLVIIMVILVASQMLSRVADLSSEESNAAAGLQRAVAALEGFASTAQRLPCPADPALDTGTEVAVGPNCTFPEGTLPWRTIGLKRDGAYDPWARKFSYRVYSGATGLTQPGGVSMVNCDTSDGGPAVAGGLCNPGATVYERDTGPAQFLAGKGYKLTDMGAATVNDVAYVILSHGPTGLGAYTVSGAQLPTPKGDEKKNTNATGDFFIHPHSDNDVESDTASHFDDLLAYRRLGDLIKRLGLVARDWPELGPTSLIFDAPTVSAAAGTSVTPGGIGQDTLNFASQVARVTGRGTSDALAEIAYDSIGGIGGLGVAGGASNLIQSSASEFLRLDFTSGAKRLGITLNDFGTYSGTFTEKVQVRFFLDDVVTGTTFVGTACRADGGLASFTVPLDSTFNRIEIVPLAAANSSGPAGITAFLVSEVKACSDGASVCRTSLDTVSNRCP